MLGASPRARLSLSWRLTQRAPNRRPPGEKGLSAAAPALVLVSTNTASVLPERSATLTSPVALPAPDGPIVATAVQKATSRAKSTS